MDVSLFLSGQGAEGPVLAHVQRAIGNRPLDPTMVFGVRLQAQQEQMVDGLRPPVHILAHRDLAAIDGFPIDDGTVYGDVKSNLTPA